MREPIAIIGIGCRFPGANNPQEFWHLLRSGKSAIGEIPPDRWNIGTLYDPDSTLPGKAMSRWGGFLHQIDQFDWRAFRILPREVKYMDPQHRLLLEVAWEALEDAGILFSEVAGSQTSVSVGVGWNDYLRLQSRNWSQISEYTTTGNATFFAANRLSYTFGLKGPSLVLDAGCASSLGAIYFACQSLWSEEADLALAGGVNLLLSPDSLIMASKSGLLSPDGLCKTLDASADGFVSGEGAGIVVLQRLSQVRSSDRVYALISGVSMNHNGHNEWIIAPNQSAQEMLLRTAYRKAGVDPAEVDYVELHGTGFRRGDAIEAKALGAVIGVSSDRRHPCMIGSVKTNIGHLGAAAGIAGVIKAALSLSHREIPPTLNFQNLNPDIHLQDLQLDIPQTTRQWPEKEAPPRAGVSAFALSGANAHAVLTASSSSPADNIQVADESNDGIWLLPLSAHTEDALYAYVAAFKDFLSSEELTQSSWQNICYTASVRRTHRQYRLAVTGRTPQEAANALSAFLQGQSVQGLYLGKGQSSPSFSDVLAYLAQQHDQVLPSLHQERTPEAVLLETLGFLYTQGFPINWPALYDEKSRCTSLPTFPWQRERLWLEWLDVEEISTPPECKNKLPQTNEVTQSQLEKDFSTLSLEEALTKLWSEVLGLEQVNADDSFFELGGHSLLATQLLTRLRAMFQVEISLNTLFKAPTPAGCAAFIMPLKNTETLPSVLPVLEDCPDQRYLPFPTTDVQQAYWVGRNTSFEAMNVGNHGYIEVETNGLDIQRFNVAMQQLIERHEMLRAVMLPDGQQRILATVSPFEARIVDLRGKATQEIIAILLQIRQEMDHQLLPIEQWPAFEIRIVLLDDQRSRIHLSVESLFIDAWSMHLLVQEFIQFYNDPHLQLPALEISFRDYILAEMALRGTDLYRRSEDYWRMRLSSLPPAPDLPLTPTTGTMIPSHFVHREAQLAAGSWKRLKARAAQAGLTPSGVLLAAFAEVLTAWSKSPRFSLNLSLFNRLPLHPQVNDIVGDFTSLIVLAIDNATPETFENRARRIQEQLWSDLDHSYYNGVRVLRDLARAQGGMMQAIMPIVFTSLLIQDMANRSPAPWQKTIHCVSQTPQVWLDHQVLESGGTLIFHWQVIEALFPAGVIDAMFAAYCQLLQRLTTEEEAWQATRLQLIPQEQLEQHTRINATYAPQEHCLLQTLFTRQVSQRPEQAAVITPDQVLSYAEVHHGSMQLAHLLRQRGAKPNQLVGIVMEKGWEQVVAALGILQSGAAYLPLDPKLPKERLHFLLEHGEVEIVVTQSYIEQDIAWPAHAQRLSVDKLALYGTAIEELEPIQKPEDLAYVIYTSGSTGLPKGVMIDHRGAVNTILDINERFHVGSQDRILALSELTFDLSVYDIFGLLAAGGTIVFPAAETALDPNIWLEQLVKDRITLWNTVPALLQMLVEFAEMQSLDLNDSCMRLALLSGDWIPLSLPDRLKTLVPDVQVVSLGGATEASIWSILYPIDGVDPSWNSVPYGKPMRNQRFYVLSDVLESCPIWVTGQLYIGGIGLAKGYWRDNEKTQTHFLIHPRSGERLYRTGDLGRYLPDGNIEFLGREDFQVKIQGYRIELGEVEATLLRHPMVQDAVVTAVGEARGEKRLVAYFVPLQEHPVAHNELRHFLEERLPDYMVPSIFVHLEKLPLTANGKVDRKALPVPTQDTMRRQEIRLAETALVAQISQMVASILNVAQIDPHANLLEYGATSLDFLRIVNLLQGQFHVRLNPALLYRLSTIAAIAQYYEQHEQESEVLLGAAKSTTEESNYSSSVQSDDNDWEEGSL